MQEAIVREAARRAMTGVSRAQWWRYERSGEAPTRVRLGPGSVGWRLSDLQRWVRERPPAKKSPKVSTEAVPADPSEIPAEEKVMYTEDELVMYTEDQLEILDRVPVDRCEVSIRLQNCLENEARFELGDEPTLGVFARMEPKRRLRIPNYGRKTEREFVELVDALLYPPNAFRPQDAVPEPEAPPSLHDLAFPLFQVFLGTPVYNNMTYEDIARRAHLAAEAYREVSREAGR